MSTDTKIIVPVNPGMPEVNEVVYLFRPESRDVTPSIDLDLLLGVYMLGTAPEFRGTGDPRPALIPADTAQHLRKILESNRVDVDGSIDRALNRKGATA